MSSDEKILNPKTGLYVKKSGKIGRSILKANNSENDKIYNPRQNKKISIYTKTGNQLSKNKQIIIENFMKNIKGKKYNNKKKHCGEEGHWLEKQMGIKPNNSKEADIYGYEQKKDSMKITYGDWSASYYIFSKNAKNANKLTRDQFLTCFGEPNKNKKNRYSWSGSCFPKYGESWNNCGQRLMFDNNNNLMAQYSFLNDNRKRKDSFPSFIKKDIITIAFWERKKLENHIKSKFGINGFYICKKDKTGVYTSICFGERLSFDYFLKGIINRNIILDSGMYQGNNRPYSSFRSNGKVWEDLITERYS